jgi:hypothetical protein
MGGGGLKRYRKYSYTKGVARENLETPSCDESLAKPMRFNSSSQIFLIWFLLPYNFLEGLYHH